MQQVVCVKEEGCLKEYDADLFRTGCRPRREQLYERRKS